MSKKVTAAQVAGLKTRGSTVNEAVNGGGSLQARKLSNSTSWRYRYRHDGKSKVHAFGTFDRGGDSSGASAAGTYTLAGARKRAESLAALQREVGDLTAHFKAEQQQAELERQREQLERKQAEQDSANHSLNRLCESYWQHLEKQGKRSAGDVRRSLTRWVVEKHPALAATRAADIRTQDVVTILRAIIDSGGTVVCNRVRSYLSAAFVHGMGSATDLLADSGSSEFGLTANPVTPIKPVSKFEKPGDRVLTSSELGELLRRLDASDKPAAKVALLSLRLGGQRIRQLLNVTSRDFDAESQTVTLYDSKGARTHPRAHMLPVPEQARCLLESALENPHPRRPGLHSGLHFQTVTNLVTGISKKMSAETGAEPFVWRDLRRTTETMLAGMGVSKDLRAQIQSHGISGIQSRHYDKYSYMAEKQNSLQAWNQRLDELAAGEVSANNVVDIRARRSDSGNQP